MSNDTTLAAAAEAAAKLAAEAAAKAAATKAEREQRTARVEAEKAARAERDASLVKRANEGESIASLAASYAMSKGRVRRILIAAGQRERTPRDAADTAERDAQIVAAFAVEGATIAKVAEQLDVSRGTVRRALRKVDVLPPRQERGPGLVLSPELLEAVAAFEAEHGVSIATVARSMRRAAKKAAGEQAPVVEPTPEPEVEAEAPKPARRRSRRQAA